MEFTKKEILEGKSTQVITEEKNKGYIISSFQSEEQNIISNLYKGLEKHNE